MPRVRAALLGMVAALTLVFAAAPSAQAALLSSFEASSSSTQAGAYADATTKFEVTDLINDPVDTLRFHLPAGAIGTIGNFDTCTLTSFYAGGCPMETQVGEATVLVNVGPRDAPFMFPITATVNVLVAGRGDTALLGVYLQYGFGKALVHVDVRPGDYGLDATLEALPNIIGGTELTLWGVPWDHWDAPTQAQNKRLPFMANPSTCGEEALTTVEVNSYEAPEVWETSSATSPAQIGCEQQVFEPEIWTSADTPFASRPSSFEFGIDVPQNNDPDKLQTPPIRNVTAVLPEGLTINPSVANGLEACSDAAFGQGSNERSTCPAGSRVGTAEFEVPALKDPHVAGSVYVGQQLPDDTYRLFVEAYGSSVRVKLKGSVRPDPDTGRLTTVFENNPEAPVSSIELSLKGGPRAALAMPDSCGAKPVSALIDSWSGHSASPSASFDVVFDAKGTPCPPQGFAPSFAAGTANPVAGGNSTFSLEAHKPDGQSDLNGIALTMPDGLLAKLKGNVGTRIGTARVAAGSGSSPFWLSGPVVLEGPYGDAPYSLRVTVPVLAGPFDLGDVVVRQKVYVDPETAQVRVVSDPFPTIVKGIPVRLQNIAVDVDKPGFMINPTSCETKTVGATLGAATGQSAAAASRFQVGDCAALGFTPRLALRLLGRGRTTSGSHPALRAVLTQPSGQANITKAKVTLPKDVVLDSKNAYDPKLLCGYDAALKTDCPASSVIGKASLKTPILNRPLSGPVHLVQGIRFDKETGNRIRTLPTLLVKLRGEVAINLRSKTAVDGSSRLVSTFPNVPDARAAKFSLRINGGRKGILVVTESRAGRIDLCNGRQTAQVVTDGHNGKRARYPVNVKTPCSGKAKKTGGRQGR